MLRAARGANRKSEPCGNEAHDLAMSGVWKAKNAATELDKEGLAGVHEYSAEGQPCAKQLYDAQVRN